MYFGGLDAECYRLRESGLSVRQIGRKLGIAAVSVQRCLARVEARRAQASNISVETGAPTADSAARLPTDEFVEL